MKQMIVLCLLTLVSFGSIILKDYPTNCWINGKYICSNKNSLSCNDNQRCQAASSFSNWQQVHNYIGINRMKTIITFVPVQTDQTDGSSMIVQPVNPPPIQQPPPPIDQPIDYSSTIQTRLLSQSQPNVNQNSQNYTFSTKKQITKVNEGDILKTDGTYIYSISQRTLSIFKAFPAKEAKLVYSKQFQQIIPKALLVSENYLVVILNGRQNFTKEKNNNQTKIHFSDNYRFLNNAYSIATYVKIYDISNKTSPFSVKQYKICGDYFGSRMQNGFVHLITQHQLNVDQNPYLWYDFGSGLMSIEPNSILYYPIDYQLQIASIQIVAFNLQTLIKPNIKAIFSRPLKYIHMPKSKIYLIFGTQQREFKRYRYTNVIRIYVQKDLIQPTAYVKIEGNTLDRFSIDEHQHYIRIFTTVYIKSQNISRLNILDCCLKPYSSQNYKIVPGEYVRLVRFTQSRCYIVTSEITDSIFGNQIINYYDFNQIYFKI